MKANIKSERVANFACLMRIVLSSVHPRSTRDSDADEEDEERRVSRGCTLQYQRALVKVLTQFHTTSTEGTDQVITMLGPDWQVDVTDLVQDSLKVADPRIAELVDRTVLVGLELGSTVLKVNRRHREGLKMRPNEAGAERSPLWRGGRRREA